MFEKRKKKPQQRWAVIAHLSDGSSQRFGPLEHLATANRDASDCCENGMSYRDTRGIITHVAGRKIEFCQVVEWED